MLPNLLIIGAMKCATVSLHHYLGLHPQIAMPPLVELDYFVAERNWQRGLDWYQSNFPVQAEVVGERSTAYAKYPSFKGVPERIHRLIPQARFIYCVRDPVDRIVSHYVHWVSRGYEKRGFIQAICDGFPKNPYIYYSMYSMQVDRYLEFFPPSQILLIGLDQMKRDRRAALRMIFEFLGVDPDFSHPDFDRVLHQSSEKRRSTWVRTRFGRMRGMYRLEIVFPWLFERPVPRPQVSESLRSQLWEVLGEEMQKIQPFLEEQVYAPSREV